MMNRAIPNGVRFAGFEILENLGAGGFGITYLVRDIKTNARYAMKEFFPGDLATRDGLSVRVNAGQETRFTAGLDAFFKEADILRTLPAVRGLIAVRGLFRRNGTAYVVMEFVDGMSLSDLILGYIKNQRNFPEELIRDFLISIGQALQVIHKVGLIHRDVKPDNIIVRRRDGQPILIDFGASRHVRTASEIVAYTPSFAALEQIPRSLRRTDGHYKEGPWTDLFSLSMVAYAMMSGHKAASAETRITEIVAGRPDPYVPVAQKCGESYSKDLCDLIDFGCALEPLKRPATAREFLKRLGAGTNSLETVDPFAAPPSAGARLARRRNALVLAGLAVLVAITVWAGLTA
ncbi:serine/threonine protein kinase [Rhodobacter capsulatus]|uniref:serine/threonine protein kinase n=1 Tax=Rhodobacter capsulatus TaxID=1061 RepID=UPI004029EFC7